jgi:hypothetical protein
MVCECPEGKQPLGGGGYCYNMEGGFPPAISQSAPLGANWSIAFFLLVGKNTIREFYAREATSPRTSRSRPDAAVWE